MATNQPLPIASGWKACASALMPSTTAQTPHIRARAMAVVTGQTMATMPKMIPRTPLTTSIFQLTLSQS